MGNPLRSSNRQALFRGKKEIRLLRTVYIFQVETIRAKEIAGLTVRGKRFRNSIKSRMFDLSTECEVVPFRLSKWPGYCLSAAHLFK